MSDALAQALAIARAAGELALQLRGGAVERKPDGSEVTAADRACEVLVRARLAAAFPGDAVLGEEQADDAARLTSRRLWIVDPIDGTRDYAAGGSDWAVQLALAVDERLVLGVVVLPAQGAWMAGGPGLGVQVDGLPAQPVAPHRDVLLTSKGTRDYARLSALAAALPDFRWERSSCVGAKIARLWRGDGDVYVHPYPINEWDSAAPAAVALACGWAATDLTGAELVFNQPRPCGPGLAISRRADHHALLAQVAAAGIVAE